MRGKDLLLMFGKNSNRITPAYAGKRPEGSLRNGSHWDHPRVCGEKQSRNPGLGMAWGSPPHMRGKDCKEAKK